MNAAHSPRNPVPPGSGLSRRHVLRAAALAGAASAFGPGIDSARAAVPTGLTVSPYDASTSDAIVGFTAIGDKTYGVTRGQVPPKVVSYDATTRDVTRVGELTGSSGEGAWATALVGTNLYAATYPDAKLIRYDVTTGNAVTVRSIGGYGDVPFHMVERGGVLYTGMYNGGNVVFYNTTNGAYADLGRVAANSSYARFVAADASHVFAATLVTKVDDPVGFGIYRQPRSDQAAPWTKIWSPPATSKIGGLGGMLYGGGKLWFTHGRSLFSMNTDGSAVSSWGAPNPLDNIHFDAATGDVHVTGGQSGVVYRLTPGSSALVALGTGPTLDGFRGVTRLSDGRVAGMTASGLAWDLTTSGSGWSQSLGGLDAAVLGAEKLQSICASGSSVAWVGGHFSVTMHNIGTGAAPIRYRVPGEVKTLSASGDHMIMGLYPSAEIRAISRIDGGQQTRGHIGNGQQRPSGAVVHSSGAVLVASQPTSGGLTGAVTKVSPDFGAPLEVHTEFLPNQGVTAVAVDGDLGYAGGSRLGGGSATPVDSSAKVAVFDVPTMTLLETITLPSGHRGDTIAGLAIADGVLYCLYQELPAARWVAYSLSARTVVNSGTVPGYGRAAVQSGRVFFGSKSSTTSDGIHRVGSTAAAVKPCYPNLGDNWYTTTQLSFRGTSLSAFTAYNGKLARADLSAF